MTSLVEMIEQTKANIVELTEMEKKNGEILAKVKQDQENIVKNLSMNKKILETLTGIKEEEIRAEMQAEEKQPEKNTGIKPKKPLYAVDEKREIIAEYTSTVEASRDLKIAQSSVSVRLNKQPIDKQIQHYGYALVLKENWQRPA